MQQDLAVAMVTNCRQPVLLRTVVSQWVGWGIPVYVSTDMEGISALSPIESSLLHIKNQSVSSKDHGRAFADALRRAGETSGWVLRQDDDIIGEYQDASRQVLGIRMEPDSVSGVRLLDPSGRRWYDWAKFDSAGASLLSYKDKHDQSYVTGGAQLISRGALDVVAATYEENSQHRTASDAKACLAARQAGYSILSPNESGPAFIHLDPKRMVNVPHSFSQDNKPKDLQCS
jgi:hypothetical protein